MIEPQWADALTEILEENRQKAPSCTIRLPTAQLLRVGTQNPRTSDLVSPMKLIQSS